MQGRRNGGFTLVELLVVIGIITILIAILLPALSRARDQSKSIQCLANLREIGHAIHLYAAEQKGYLVPGIIYSGPSTSGDNGEPVENYATLLVYCKYLRAPSQPNFSSPESTGYSVLRCPDGINLQQSSAQPPSNLFDQKNRFFWRRFSSLLNTSIDTWYAANCMESTSVSSVYNQRWPLRRLDRDPFTGQITGSLYKITQIKRASDMTLLFDGLRVLDSNMARLSPRHFGNKYVNFLLADGHVASVHYKLLPTSSGPTAATASITSNNTGGPYTQTSDFLNYQFPQFRMDQP